MEKTKEDRHFRSFAKHTISTSITGDFEPMLIKMDCEFKALQSKTGDNEINNLQLNFTTNQNLT